MTAHSQPQLPSLFAPYLGRGADIEGGACRQWAGLQRAAPSSGRGQLVARDHAAREVLGGRRSGTLVAVRLASGVLSAGIAAAVRHLGTDGYIYLFIHLIIDRDVHTYRQRLCLCLCQCQIDVMLNISKGYVKRQWELNAAGYVKRQTKIIGAFT